MGRPEVRGAVRPGLEYCRMTRTNMHGSSVMPSPKTSYSRAPGWMRPPFLLAVAVLTLVVAAPPALHAQDALDRLEAEIVRLSAAAEGVVGIAAHHIESGTSVVTHAGEAFPMASTYKVPIAIQLLTLVDRGELRLDSMVTLGAEDLHPGSGTLSSDLFNDPGVALSVRNLMELMLLISDNSATDLCLKLAGGADKVNARMSELGVSGVRVDRPTSLLIGDWLGMEGLPESGDIAPEDFRRRQALVSDQARARAGRAFDRDPQDTSTPDGMADLLLKAWKGEALSEESTALFWDVMKRVQTGVGRIKGRLPAGTTVYHKTGTIGRTTNDVGVIELPHGAGHVILVAYVKESEVPIPARETVIAEVSRTVHDYFVFMR